MQLSWAGFTVADGAANKSPGTYWVSLLISRLNTPGAFTTREGAILALGSLISNFCSDVTS